MSEDNQKRIFTGVLVALGAALAFFGVRWVIGRIQRRASDEEYQQRQRQRLQRGTREFASQPLRVPEQPRYQPQDQPDRAPIPATGASADTAEMTMDMVEDQGSTVELDQQVTPLVQYLLTFHDFITILRERRRGGPAGDRSLTAQDRGSFQETLDRLAENVEDFGEGNLKDDSLQERVYRLTRKVRGALENLGYSDDDLFRINGEVRSEACRLLREIEGTRANIDEDFDRALQAYDC
ncbi:MAG: hypothetical protein EHM21_07520 [Chloroflexi bacterium]|nr:MAG: hypothetical protein EHM21_07520 [Chloroflexota bacterium]